jgi:hypothetical protein
VIRGSGVSALLQRPLMGSRRSEKGGTAPGNDSYSREPVVGSRGSDAGLRRLAGEVICVSTCGGSTLLWARRVANWGAWLRVERACGVLRLDPTQFNMNFSIFLFRLDLVN